MPESVTLTLTLPQIRAVEQAALRYALTDEQASKESDWLNLLEALRVLKMAHDEAIAADPFAQGVREGMQQRLDSTGAVIGIYTPATPE